MSFAFIIYILIFIVGYLSYNHHKPANVLVCLFALGTGCFKVFPLEGFLVHPYDMMIFLTLIITFLEITKTNGYLRCKNDPIGKIILIVLMYTGAVMIGSIVSGQEILSFAFKTYRVNFIFLLYFYYRRQSLDAIKRFIGIIIFFSIAQGILFYLQLAGIELLEGGGVMNNTGVVRYKGYPSLTAFFVLLAMLDDKMNIRKRFLMLIFFGGMLLLSMTRGPILTIVIAYGTYILVHRRFKNLVYLGVFAVVFFMVVAPVLEKRNNERSSGADELRTILENPLASHESFTAGSGSVLYRVACVTERMGFLLDNPQYLPFGIGVVHENSPRNHYNLFITGLPNEVLQYGKETISSDDVTWVNILMRYGIIGALLFALIYIIGAKVAIPLLRISEEPLFIVAGTLPLAYLFASFGTNHFDFAIRLLEFLFPFIIIRVYYRQSQVVNK